MAHLKLPDGAEAGFRYAYVNAFGGRFTINVYGTGQNGWFVASLRDIESRNSGWQELNKGDWPALIHMIGRSGF